MGLTALTLEVANPAESAVRASVEFLVDSGAVYSLVPREILARLGIRPHGRQQRRLVALPAVRNRGEKRRVGLDEKTVRRRRANDVAERAGVLERHDAGERQREAECEAGLGLGC